MEIMFILLKAYLMYQMRISCCADSKDGYARISGGIEIGKNVNKEKWFVNRVP